MKLFSSNIFFNSFIIYLIFPIFLIYDSNYNRMSIIERLKKQADETLKEAISQINSQNQETESTINLAQKSGKTLIQQIDDPIIGEQTKNYEAQQFQYFTLQTKIKPVKCVVCKKINPKYTCPKCKIKYCSIEHYKSHNLYCTERFFKDQVQSKMKTMKASKEEKKKVIQMMKKNQEEASKDQSQLMNEVKVQEISEERLNEILSKVENEQQIKLTQNQQRRFQAYMRQIKLAAVEKQGTKQAQQQDEETKQELNPFQQYQPFWLIEEGLQLYFMMDQTVEIQQYNQSKHQQILDYRQITSELLRQDLNKISELINFKKISVFVNYELLQMVYLTALLFRSFNGEYIRNKQFLVTFMNIYDQHFGKKIAQTFPATIKQKICQEIHTISLIKTNLSRLQSKDKDILQNIRSWLPYTIQDCKCIFGNKYLCLETLYRLLQAFKSVFTQNGINWSDEAMQINKEKPKLSKQQKQEQKSILKIIKKIQFLLSYVDEIFYCSNANQNQQIVLKQINNKQIILNTLDLQLKDQKIYEKQINSIMQREQHQKQLKLNQIIIPK